MYYMREVPRLMRTDRLLETKKQPAVAQLRYDRDDGYSLLYRSSECIMIFKGYRVDRSLT